jgi:hypothetical protein
VVSLLPLVRPPAGKRDMIGSPLTGLGGSSRSAHYPTLASYVGTRRVLPSAPPRNPAVPNRPFRVRAVPSRELRFSEKLRRARSHHKARPSHPVARKVSFARATHGRPPGPRGWVSAQPLTSPGFPLVDALPVPAPSYESHIFASVSELDFSLQREAFGAVASIPEKLRLLSQPRSQRSAQTLAERPLRSFMMQVVRGKRSQTSSPSQDSAPLALRPTWIFETAPYATKEEADRIWRQGACSLTGAHSPLRYLIWRFSCALD